MKTIKLCLIAVLIGTGVFSAKAQTPDFNLGIKAGANYGTLPSSFNDLTDKGGKAGFNIGVFARVGKALYFQPELNFSTFGSKYTLNSKEYKPKFNQLNVPLMVGYKLINTSSLNFRVSAGPDFSYNLNTPDAPAGFDYKRVNLGGVINAGVDIGNITIDARYTRGFTKFNKALDEKTGIFNLSVGFKIF
ncbi:porin family protein [Pedobacter nutrimenti]|jgi:hypothetical protein|uniref:Outer membrane protein with beta-barrel domain n=1 Tax=Pedobacter nutrimenti TaxID=1241337 RepID=A0A318UDI0_9SPHI|nr:porin family protein [Pedobacter nutrimenti]PYF71520.1 outer membrane protein with beta-barrel domain [Pedobacter nutrimenti]|eukprot:gene17579-20975_t